MEKKLNGKSENTDKAAKKQRIVGVPFTKDDPRINREGRPIGTKNFATDFDEAVEEIAKANNITLSEARKVLFRKAYAQAKNGQFPYYKDIMDRYYGKAKESFDITSGGKSISDILSQLEHDRSKTS